MISTDIICKYIYFRSAPVLRHCIQLSSALFTFLFRGVWEAWGPARRREEGRVVAILPTNVWEYGSDNVLSATKLIGVQNSFYLSR